MRSIVAQVWRKSWSLMAVSPIFFNSGLKCRPVRFVPLMVVPMVVGNTKL